MAKGVPELIFFILPGVFGHDDGLVIERRLVWLVNNKVLIRRIEFCQHSSACVGKLSDVDKHAILYWKPGLVLARRLKLLLYLYFLNKVDVCLFAHRDVDLLERIAILCDPHASCKGQILRTLGKEIQPIAIEVANVKAIHEVIFIIQTPPVSNR